MIEQFGVTVPSPGGAQMRTATLYLPEKEGRFPVLYLFDGQAAFFDERSPFGESLRMGEVLDSLGAEVIVAAVDCDPKDRLTEYSPFPFTSKFGSSEGKGAVYLDWLAGTFKPAIEARCPTDGRAYLAGCSMGGLMTVYGLCRYPDVFAGGAALSPSFWVAPRAVAQMVKDAKWEKSPVFYLDYGSRELKNHGAQQRSALSAVLQALVMRGATVTFRLIEGGTHGESSWRAQIPVFLKALGLLR